jgi:queuine tRNA-ribosyltransferase
MSHQVVRTRKGLVAMRDLDAGEVMHPGVGPLVEAEQLYVRQSRLGERLRTTEGRHLVVFDIGMGAGSNALAARAESERTPAGAARLELVSFERDLGALELALTQPADFALEGECGDAARALLAHGIYETGRTLWRLQHGDIREALPREACLADIVFWDPFSPKANPDLWTIAALSAVRRVAHARCTLFTYSASTSVRSALLLAGWAVGVGESIGEKAATTAAAVVATDLARPLDRSWLARLSRPDAPLPSDAPADIVARISALPQFCPPCSL